MQREGKITFVIENRMFFPYKGIRFRKKDTKWTFEPISEKRLKELNFGFNIFAKNENSQSMFF